MWGRHSVLSVGPRAAVGMRTPDGERSVSLQASFPANLQLVLVLRPTGFFQRTLSDLAFRFNRDDFKMKVPVSAYLLWGAPTLPRAWGREVGVSDPPAAAGLCLTSSLQLAQGSPGSCQLSSESQGCVVPLEAAHPGSCIPLGKPGHVESGSWSRAGRGCRQRTLGAQGLVPSTS